MPYYIVHYVAEKETGREHWPGSLDEAREMAENAVESGAATRVEILGRDGVKVAQFPRTVRRA